MNEAFDGAAGVTNLGNHTLDFSHTCELCEYTSPFASSFAYIKKDTKAFRFVEDEGLDRAAMGDSWKQRGGGIFEFACFGCCGKLHNHTLIAKGTDWPDLPLGEPMVVSIELAQKRIFVSASARGDPSKACGLPSG